MKTLIAAVLLGITLCAAGPSLAQTKAVATFGSGCFWCTEADFDKVPGVLETISGFMGGKTPNPTYRQVVSGGTGHAEVVQVTYDPAKVSYADLLAVYWKNVDPFDASGQFCDKGNAYRPVIFTHTPEQRRAAETSKTEIAALLAKRFKDTIKVRIEAAAPFTAAEAYHQNYHQTNPLKYNYYRWGCGRDQRLREIWGGSG